VASLYKADAYQIVWQSARAFAVLLPLAICWRLISGYIAEPREQRILFAMCAFLAWASLGQFPFSAPIYFCYVTPLVVIAGVAAANRCSSSRQWALSGWVGLLFVFATVSMNRGYIYNLGQFHAPERFDTDLNLPKAHLRVTARDALTYQRLSAVIADHLSGGGLMAGPDCPQVFFFSNRFNPSGALFDFLAAGSTADEQLNNRAAWRGTDVIVINHVPPFSPRPSMQLVSDIRKAFSVGEFVGQFEVRWR
jgi:hypothetical protein